MYQLTSSSVKYKAKSWIDIFGAKGSKDLGSIVTDVFSNSATNLVNKDGLVDAIKRIPFGASPKKEKEKLTKSFLSNRQKAKLVETN